MALHFLCHGPQGSINAGFGLREDVKERQVITLKWKAHHTVWSTEFFNSNVNQILTQSVEIG